MKLSKADIEAIADKSRFYLAETEKDDLTEFLSNILDYFDKIDDVDTEGAEPAAGMGDADSVMRDDVALPSLQRDAILGNAAYTKDGFFCVPYIWGTGK